MAYNGKLAPAIGGLGGIPVLKAGYNMKLSPSVGGGLGGIPVSKAGYYGEAIFLSPGKHYFTVPYWVTSLSAVCIGGGGAYSYANNGNRRVSFGAGGGLGWISNIPVSQEMVLEVTVGECGQASRIKMPDGLIIVEGGGGNSTNGVSGGTANGGTWIGDGGGAGGMAIGISANDIFYGRGTPAGGGAGGYLGDGGNGLQVPVYGTGAGAGGSTNCGGGGVGLYGLGSTAIALSKGGSGGADGTNGSGGLYGGGVGSSYFPEGAVGELKNSSGAVRIIWGKGRSFPNNAS